MKKKLIILATLLTTALAAQVILQSQTAPVIMRAKLTPDQTSLALSNLASIISLPTNSDPSQILAVHASRTPDGGCNISVTVSATNVVWGVSTNQ